MHRVTVLAAVLLTALLVLAACTEQEPDIAEADQVPEDLVADENDEAPDPDDDVAAEQTVEFLAGDMYYDELPGSVGAGVIEFVMENEGAAEHDMVIEELDEEVVPLTSGGETGSGTVELEPDTYTLYCSVPGHREAGMEATLEVE